MNREHSDERERGDSQQLFLEDRGAFVARVEERLSGVLAQTQHPLLRTAAEHLCTARATKAKAKRIRPRLVWAFGSCTSPRPDAEELVRVAVAAELIHSASLLHDDVVDAGQMRRGRPTVNARWGNAVAVLAGDMLLTQALTELPGRVAGLAARTVETVATMTEAAMSEVEARGRMDLTTDHWRRIAAGKTGALFSWCGEAAAALVRDQSAARRLARCGHHLGLAFQLADDLKDLGLVPTGKDRFADLRNREASYLVVAALEVSTLRCAIEQLWRADCSERELLAVGQAILTGKVAADAIAYCKKELDEASSALGPLRSTLGGETVSEWIEMLRQKLLAVTARSSDTSIASRERQERRL